MPNYQRLLGLYCLLLVACSSPAATQPPTKSPATATPAGPPPQITAVVSDKTTVGLYERLELMVDMKASYNNPFDSQEIALDALFIAPSGKTWNIPGFWDGHDSWNVRFTPSEQGTWQYTMQVRDANGTAESTQASFIVESSSQHGWLQVASWRDPQLSSRYLVYHDGTPFYGVGHCDAFTLGDLRMDANGDLNLLKRMREHNENLVVWWPHYTFTFFANSYKTYDRIDMELIDSYLASAERQGIIVMYTIWDHNLLRGAGHPWGVGRWQQNGFNQITPDAADFFTDPTSWRWQENLYRYLIARWGYSPSIIWMTVSELNGTSGGANQDAWHAKINDYFVNHDPYRHPTTASLSGDQYWQAGFAITDIPQVHLYEAQKDPVQMADSVATWTTRMWQEQARPNVVGEYGTTNRSLDLPMLHNSSWAALMNGAAITPLRWSDRGNWGRMREPLMEQLGHLHTFVADVPFAELDLKPATITVEGTNLTTHGLANDSYALVWLWDRQAEKPQDAVELTLSNLRDGLYRVQPYNPWDGEYGTTIEASAQAGQLKIVLPTFERDIALKISAAP
jgi:hypothetical protein